MVPKIPKFRLLRLSGLAQGRERLIWIPQLGGAMEDQVSETWIKGVNILPGLAISLSHFWKPTVEEGWGSPCVLH